MRAFIYITIGTVAFFQIFLRPFYGQGEVIKALVIEQANEEKLLSLNFDFVRQIPEGEQNFSSGTMSAAEVRQLAQSGVIRTWIRMNGDGRDQGKLSIAEEKKIVEAAGIEFIFLNVHATGLEKSARIIHAKLLEGNVLLHCRHGYDRTGAMVGYHLRQLGWSRAEVVKYNHWGWDYVQRKGSSYSQYWEMIN